MNLNDEWKKYSGIRENRYSSIKDVQLCKLNFDETRLYSDVHRQIYENPAFSGELKGIPIKLLGHPIVLKAKIDAEKNLKGLEKLISYIN